MDTSQNLVHKILELNEYLCKLEKSGVIIKKSKSHSEKLRIQGNNLFKQCKHDQRKHKKLVSLYTESIAFAPEDSEELPKAFSNRSVALMHLHLYEEAIIDIDRALLISKSDDLKAKLVSRREKCLQCKDESNNTKLIPDELPKIEPSKIMLSASEAVAIKYNEKFGRHLVATRDIKPGEVIIVEQSYVCFPKQEKIYSVCSHCLRFVWNGVPCDTCAFAIFCSEECKNKAWQEYHDVECSIISSLFFLNSSNITNGMIVVRSIIKAIKSEGFESVMNEIKNSNEQKDSVEILLHNGILNSQTLRSHYNLLFHEQNDEEEKYNDYKSFLLVITLFLRHTTIIPVHHKIKDFDTTDNELIQNLIHLHMKLRNIFKFNSHMYQDREPSSSSADLSEVKESCDSVNGTLVAATSNLINHSCCPNVRRLFLPGKIVMYTLAPIKQDQQLCDSYGPVFFSSKKEKRQEYLKENYNFICSCQACEEDWSPNVEWKDIISTPAFEAVIKDFKSYYPNENVFNVIIGFISQQCYEKSTLEKVLIYNDLIFKYFDYRTAYHHCLRSIICIAKSFIELYGEKYVIPEGR